jgi:hypothetical protein
MTKVVFVLTFVLACIAAPQASAAAPVLLTAGATNLHSTATWSFPAGVEARIVEVASNPTVDSDGYFQANALEAGDSLTPSQTTWTDVFQLEPSRTYYLHVGGRDTSCVSCPAVEFSNIISFTVGTATAETTATARITIRNAGSGSGRVTSNPSGLDCSTTCTETFPRDIHVTLTPKPAPGSIFTGWSGGGCFGWALTCEVLLNVSQTVVATFDVISPPSLPELVVGRDSASATATVTVCDDSPGPLTIALIQVWRDRGQWKSTTTTTTQDHLAGCRLHAVSGPLAVPSAPAMWIAVQVTDVDGRQSSLRTAPAS